LVKWLTAGATVRSTGALPTYDDAGANDIG
jgi:hypothetical protein